MGECWEECREGKLESGCKEKNTFILSAFYNLKKSINCFGHVLTHSNRK